MKATKAMPKAMEAMKATMAMKGTKAMKEANRAAGAPAPAMKAMKKAMKKVDKLRPFNLDDAALLALPDLPGGAFRRLIGLEGAD